MSELVHNEHEVTQFTPDQERIIKQTIAPGLADDELQIFLHNCIRTKLDPIAKQIYAIKRNGRMCIQTGIDGFRLIAERTGKYAPGRDTEFIYNDGNLLGAKVYVKKMTPDGTWHDISAVALLSEYRGNTPIWSTMPHVMIEKCAEARALRRAFPADLSGIYSAEEMDQEDDAQVSQSAAPIEAAPIEVAPMIPADAIDEETWQKLDEYLNGHEELRKKLKNLCKVQDLRYIKKQQLDAVRKYAKNYFK